ncbi:hypothetical protein K0T92_08790 [Paenibacillus oenotherae]|uniref:Uncharacterized protein n=1 Tax=Paenibacillus oenotherae TaxID=1435645 RepID=A0ABS7D4M8_9BACL|nr:hypothetical protein [Paenibacillus oenotherae]MBW7474840.1 hypothetical protein [Paenibacillus oenotherae]
MAVKLVDVGQLRNVGKRELRAVLGFLQLENRLAISYLITASSEYTKSRLPK